MTETGPGLRTVALVKQVPAGGGTGALGADGRLRREGLVAEIVRMLGGDDSEDAAVRHARELLKAA